MQTKTVENKHSSFVPSKNKAIQRVALLFIGLVTITGAASAGEIINTTAITGIFTDLGVIFPSMGNLVVSILPTVLTLAVVGFATGFFDKVLGIFDKVF